MPDTFTRRIQLDLSRELIPQLVELTDDPDPEVSRWAAENLRSGVAPNRLALEEPSLYEQFRLARRPKLTVVRKP
jgi:hypothetical protein